MRTWGGSFDTSFRNDVMRGTIRGMSPWTSDDVDRCIAVLVEVTNRR